MTPLPVARAAIVALLVFGALTSGAQSARPAPKQLHVTAGAHDRRNTIVPVTLPALSSPPWTYVLRDTDGTEIPVQIERDGRGWFVLPALDAGSTRVYPIVVQRRVAAKVIASHVGSDIAIAVGGKPVLTYVGVGRLPSSDIKPAYQRGGYIHPVHAPSGRIVTDDYPADHRHQHGVMFAWTSAEFEGRKTDFWNMGNALGRVEAISFVATAGGAVYAGWTARHRYIDLTSGAPKPALNEEWTTRVYAPGPGQQTLHIFDVDIRQTAVMTAPLVLPEYHYGGMAVRGAASFMGAPTNEIVLTAEGKDRVTADGARARWVHIAGQVDGALAGIAMLGHPDNFRAPEPMRVHPVDPYICFVPSRLGTWSITAERPHVARYRFVAADGPADAALLDRLWRDYADPPAVTIK